MRTQHLHIFRAGLLLVCLLSTGCGMGSMRGVEGLASQSQNAVVRCRGCHFLSVDGKKPQGSSAAGIWDRVWYGRLAEVSPGLHRIAVESCHSDSIGAGMSVMSCDPGELVFPVESGKAYQIRGYGHEWPSKETIHFAENVEQGLLSGEKEIRVDNKREFLQRRCSMKRGCGPLYRCTMTGLGDPSYYEGKGCIRVDDESLSMGK